MASSWAYELRVEVRGGGAVAELKGVQLQHRRASIAPPSGEPRLETQGAGRETQHPSPWSPSVS